jgi:hypothetical protein
VTAVTAEIRQARLDEPQDLIPEVRSRTRSRRHRLGLSAAILALAVALGVFATLGAPPSSNGGGRLIPYSGAQLLALPTSNAVNSCQLAFTRYRQTDKNAMASGRASSVIAAYATTAASLDRWSGASRGTFAGYPGSAPFDVCYLSGTWVQNPDTLMGTPTFHETIYVIGTARTPPGHPPVPSRYLTVMGASLLQHIPPPAPR